MHIQHIIERRNALKLKICMVSAAVKLNSFKSKEILRFKRCSLEFLLLFLLGFTHILLTSRYIF